MSTEAVALQRDDTGRTTGLVARDDRGELRIDADLTVLADGRDDRLRAEAGLTPREFGVPIDVLWFRLDHPAGGVPPDTLAYVTPRTMLVTIPRTDYYQCGLLIPKGAFDEVRAAGLGALRDRITGAAPFLRGSAEAITEWSQVKLLAVQIDRLECWWTPGLLAIGDAAHAMSPAFGVGINYAIQDAVAAANALAAPLRDGSDLAPHLAALQRRRLPPVTRMQALQLRAHRLIAGRSAAILHTPPRWYELAMLALVLPIARRAAARIVGRGFRPERLDDVPPTRSGQRSPATPST
jgi:2-polyprenyl-6-methoxyphenol hydroxylase-like FAD-dependent oxidoreductase